MALLDVVFRVLDKAGVSFIEPRREDGHGSAAGTPTYTEVVAQPNAVVQLGSSPVSSLNPFPITGTVTSVGTELAVQDAINTTGYNLQAAAYSTTTAIGGNYLLDRIELLFSTNEIKDITITDSNGAILRQVLGSNLTSRVFRFDQQAFASGDNITITVTQTAGPCLMDVQVVILTGSVSLGGNPVIDSASFGKPVTSNSTNTPLGIGGVFLGAAESDGFPDLLVSCFSSHSGLLEVEYSLTNGVTWLPPLAYIINAGLSEFHVQRKGYHTYRVRYTNNSGSAQTRFELGVFAGSFGQKVSTLNTAVREDEDCTTTRSIPYEDIVTEGRAQGRFIVNKFGRNPAITSGSVPEDVWDGSGVYTGFPTSGSAETLRLISSDPNDTAAGSGAQTVLLEGLGADYQIQTELVSLNGTVGVNSVLTWRRLHRAIVQSAGTNTTNVGDITIRHTTTVANVFAVMQAGRGRTAVASYTVPAGYTAYLKTFGASVLSNNSVNAELDLWVREFGKAVTLQNAFAVSNTSETKRSFYGGIRFPEKTDLTFRVVDTTSATATDVTVYYDLLVVENL